MNAAFAVMTVGVPYQSKLLNEQKECFTAFKNMKQTFFFISSLEMIPFFVQCSNTCFSYSYDGKKHTMPAGITLQIFIRILPSSFS
jgi:hypothetical protein